MRAPVPPDFQEARQWFEKGAAAGDKLAEDELKKWQK